LPQYLATRNSPVLISVSPVISMIAPGSAVVCVFAPGSKRSETQAHSSAIWSGTLGRISSDRDLKIHRFAHHERERGELRGIASR
jgi:hypothetical protein